MSPPPERDARFRDVFTDTYPDVLRFAKRRVDDAEAEDATAETFLVLWRRLDEAPTRPSDVRAWLFGVTRHCLLNARRGQQRHDALTVRLGEARTPMGEQLDAEDIAQRVDLAAAWHRLDDSQQEVLALTALDDLTSSQAARVLGTTATAYRLRLMRARAALRRELDTPDSSDLIPQEARR